MPTERNIIIVRGALAIYGLTMFVMCGIAAGINGSLTAWLVAGTISIFLGMIWFEGTFGFVFCMAAPFLGPVAVVMVMMEFIQSLLTGDENIPFLFRGDEEISKFLEEFDELIGVPEEADK